MANSDLEIKAKVRAVLSKHWVDLQLVGFDCCRGTVRFRGELLLRPGHDVSLGEVSLVELLETEIRRIRGVRKVYFLGVKLHEPKPIEHEEERPRTRLTLTTRPQSPASAAPSPEPALELSTEKTDAAPSSS